MNTRRNFFKFISKSAAVAILSPVIFTDELHAGSFSDGYKAIVYISLVGGNDAFNMVIPTKTDGGSGYDNYKDIRTDLAIPNIDLSSNLRIDTDGNLDISLRNPYAYDITIGDEGSETKAYLAGYYPINGTDIAINAVMPEIAHLMNTGKVAVLGNIGTLVEPGTKDEIRNKTVSLPIHLFSHNQQHRVLSTGIADNNSATGWAGRLFEKIGDVGGTGILSNNISFAGYSHLLTGATKTALNLSPNPEKHKTRNPSLRKELANTNELNPFRRLYGNIITKSYDLSETLATTLQAPKVFLTTDAYGASLFKIPGEDTLNFSNGVQGNLIKQIEAVTKMIDYATTNGLQRQIFHIRLTGFDTHSSQRKNHPRILRELSMALGKFQLAMEEMGLSDKVTTFTTSDFGRSVANNGGGTDHAWAGHNLVMGGAVDGGKLYGEIPDFTLSGPQDIGGNGRMIPTLSLDQQYSTVLKWFGIDDTTLDSVFPNLSNFDNSIYGRDIGFMKT